MTRGTGLRQYFGEDGTDDEITQTECPACRSTGLARCPVCAGKGVEKPCADCGGSGLKSLEFVAPQQYRRISCKACGGIIAPLCLRCEGRGVSGECEHCHGRGTVDALSVSGIRRALRDA